METTTMPARPQRSASGTVDTEHYHTRACQLRAHALRRMTRELVVGLARLVERLHEAVRAYRRRRAAYRELSALDAKALHDIGIVRTDIDAVANGSFARDPSRCRRHVPLSLDTPAPATPWVQRERPGIRHAACCG